jgi:hypothetical protein
MQLRELTSADTQLALLLAERAAAAVAPSRSTPRPALEARLARHRALDSAEQAVSPFDRMQHCRDSLNYLDTCGWKRSYHQRLFHEDFLVCLEFKLSTDYNLMLKE